MQPIKELLKVESESESLNYITKNSIFIADRTFIEDWIEGKNEENSAYTRAYMDLLSRLKEDDIVLPEIFIPVDVLIEMENDGKKYVKNKDFIDALNTFMKVKEVDPEKEFSGNDAVYEMAKQFSKNKKKIIILTTNKKPYTQTSSIFILSVKEMFFRIIIIYNLLCEKFTDKLRNIFENWLNFYEK